MPTGVYVRTGRGPFFGGKHTKEAKRKIAEANRLRVYKKIPAEQRFWAKVKKRESCWEWVGGVIGGGYGRFWDGNKYIVVHRFSYELHIEKIPVGLLVCHRCDNPPCVNPEHLFLGTHSDNMWDKVKKGRDNVPKGEDCSSAKLTWSKVGKIRDFYKKGEYNQPQLGIKFGVDQSVVSDIVNNKIWKIQI